MDFSQVTTVISITVICYLIGMGAKNVICVKDELIPFIVGVCGGILGIAGMFIIPDYPASDFLNAVAVGIVSGLASTGAHQIVKQAKKM